MMVRIQYWSVSIGLRQFRPPPPQKKKLFYVLRPLIANVTSSSSASSSSNSSAKMASMSSSSSSSSSSSTFCFCSNTCKLVSQEAICGDIHRETNSQTYLCNATAVLVNIRFDRKNEKKCQKTRLLLLQKKL